MSTRPLLTDSTPHLVEPSDEIATLRKELREVRERLDDLEEGLQQYRNRIGAMLHALSGDAASSTVNSTSTLQPPNDAAWEMWKRRLPGACPKVIDALLIQPLTATQLISATGTSFSTVHRALGVLKGNALIEKDGTKIRLKRL